MEERKGERGGSGRPHSRTFPYLSVLCNKEAVLKKLGPINNFYATLLRFLHSCYPEDVVDVESQLQWHQTTHAYTHNWLQQSGYTIAAKYGSV